jgi:hypothetical protein
MVLTFAEKLVAVASSVPVEIEERKHVVIDDVAIT